MEYFTTTGAKDPKIKEKIFGLLKDESYSIFSDKRIQEIAVEYLSKYARKESMKRAPDLFKKDESTKRGAYKLMKALLTAQ